MVRDQLPSTFPEGHSITLLCDAFSQKSYPDVHFTLIFSEFETQTAMIRESIGKWFSQAPVNDDLKCSIQCLFFSRLSTANLAQAVIFSHLNDPSLAWVTTVTPNFGLSHGPDIRVMVLQHHTRYSLPWAEFFSGSLDFQYQKV